MAVLGVELGSTRIKSVVLDSAFQVKASGSHTWENRLQDGYWTYSLDDVWRGLNDAIGQMDGLTNVTAIGVSAMMHGYLAFDKNGELLVPFRTWRNTTTEQASAELTELFGFNIPQRWSIAHLYQAILNGETHVSDIAFMTTLAGYVHWQLTGEKVIGIGDASGMFPIRGDDYNAEYVELFRKKTGIDVTDIFPKILVAGQTAGYLTRTGAKLLDDNVKEGIQFCPPEGDAGTGMVATNSIAPRTGNISAGTSIFEMIVLQKPLSRVYPEVDIVTTPTGEDVAMIHCNNCTGDLDAWVNVFAELSPVKRSELYDYFYNSAMNGDADCGGLVTCNYYSGEPIVGVSLGLPLVMRMPDSNFTFSNFARSLLYSSVATLRLGYNILKEENVQTDKLCGHGGLFKTQNVGALFLASALRCDVTVMESAGEGGAYGIALLAGYLGAGTSLADYLNKNVFSSVRQYTKKPDAAIANGFDAYLKRFKKIIKTEKFLEGIL